MIENPTNDATNSRQTIQFNLSQLDRIKQHLVKLAQDYGFQEARISDCDTADYFERFKAWVDQGFHGEMSFLERNQGLRQTPAELHPETLRVISLRYNYLPEDAGFAQTLRNKKQANVSRYALGKDYHKLLRKKLQRLTADLEQFAKTTLPTDFQLSSRVFVDSAPVLETAFAEKSGLGWKGKHSLVINKEAGSWFFLAEIFINIPLEVDQSVEDLCGSCSACINLCPTQAILADKTIDAKRCISYLTIENKLAIPVELRPKLGNRIYGCDDCQLACPWNRYADLSQDQAFSAKHKLDKASLISLFEYDQAQFLKQFEGSPIRRIGYQSWLRNLAVAIGNDDYSKENVKALLAKKSDIDQDRLYQMVLEHIDWALEQQYQKQNHQFTVDEKLSRLNNKLIRCVETMLPRDA
jgi:epoxyqueuosine reductase